ncbi:MAG: hypothetical protein RLZ40_804, partial [Actinomycetota bacterium]
ALGAVVLGKTQTLEFACGGRFPPTRNPWDLSRTPGGSSSGSGAAVADPEGAPLTSGAPSPAQTTSPALVIIGPEGGFDADEIPSSAARVSLGDTILRAETATLVAATLLVARRAQ